MFRKISLSIVGLCLAQTFSASAMADIYSFQPETNAQRQLSWTPDVPPGISKDLAGHEYMLIPNPFFYDLSGYCIYTISPITAEVPVQVEMERKSGAFNGHTIHEKDKLIITVKNGDRMELFAEALARVRIENMSDIAIHADCWGN